LGRASIRSRTGSEAEHYEGLKRRLLYRTWPEKRLLITAVEAETGQFVVFDKDSGVPVVEAVAASCAVPLIWPPVTINGKRYVDGGVRSVGNVDLATGYERVVVIAPITQALRRADRPDSQVAALGQGVRSILICPDPASAAAIGQNPLDPAQRAPSAQAGRAQGLAQVAQVRAIWS
jgi:NTE family protein